jgi:hypothetical protein
VQHCLVGSEMCIRDSLMNEVQTDEQLGGTAGQLGHLMQIPDLVVKGAGAHGGASSGTVERKAAIAGITPAAPAATG